MKGILEGNGERNAFWGTRDGSGMSVSCADMKTSQVRVPEPAQEAHGPVTPALWWLETGGLLRIAGHHHNSRNDRAGQ